VVQTSRKIDRELQTTHQSLAESLRIRRTAAGLTQDELAIRAGLERKTVNRIENERLSPTIDTLVRLALVLKCSVADLIQGS
jgi:transcriptional regulator with XRE-family HTH domain